jgi:hypothetical protein
MISIIKIILLTFYQKTYLLLGLSAVLSPPAAVEIGQLLLSAVLSAAGPVPTVIAVGLLGADVLQWPVPAEIDVPGVYSQLHSEIQRKISSKQNKNKLWQIVSHNTTLIK